MISKGSLLRVNLDPGTWLNRDPAKGIFVAISDSWIENHVEVIKVLLMDGQAATLNTDIFDVISES
jgi:hypothetical protein